jgi:hypothetical protein
LKYAIGLPGYDNLQRNVTELLSGPVGRPSPNPVMRYKSFRYQAASWKMARRVVAVEFLEKIVSAYNSVFLARRRGWLRRAASRVRLRYA